MKTNAIFPGTFDPITNGHVDLIRRAAGMFDSLIVAVGASVGKQPLLSLDKRVELVKALVSDWPSVTVQSYDGLLVDFAQQNEVKIIVRSFRRAADMDYEMPMAHMNHTMYPELETLFLAAAPKFAYISSTQVRDIARLGGDISAFVPAEVVKALA